MTWLVSAFVGMISGLAGLFLAGLIAIACVSWYQISSREGESGYFVIFIALFGGFVGITIGFLTARTIAWSIGPGFGRELLGATVAVLLVSATSILICRVLADIAPTIDGQELDLQVEFRFPDSYGLDERPNADGDWLYTFASLSGMTRRKDCVGTIQWDECRYEEGQWIVPTCASLFTERGKRNVMLAQREATEVMSFLLPLPARPSAEYERWSDWIPRQQANGEPWPSNKMSCRFRVQKIVSPPDPQP